MPKTNEPSEISGRCSKCKLGGECLFASSPGFQSIVEDRFYSPGYTVFKQRQKAEFVYRIREGWLELSHYASTARSMTDLAGPNTILGLVEAMTGTTFSVTAKTINAGALEVVEAQKFLDFLKENPAILFKVSTNLSVRFQKMMHSFYDLAGRVSAQKRLMRELLEIAESCGNHGKDGTLIELPLTIQTLADKIGCSRQYTSKLLDTLKQKGLIVRKNGWFLITHKGVSFRYSNGIPPE